MPNDILAKFDPIIKATQQHHPEVQKIIDGLKNEIFHHFDSINQKVLNRREDLLIALRLTEGINIFNWIEICLIYGSYFTVFRELRFLLESVCQAFHIDINHPKASLETKLEILKAVSNIRISHGNRLIEKIPELKEKEKIKKLYSNLSGYVHPSFKERKHAINEVDDVLKIEYNEELLLDCLKKCEETAKYIILIDSHFQKRFLNILNSQ